MNDNSKIRHKGLIVDNTNSGTYPQVVMWSHMGVNDFFEEDGVLKDKFSIEPDYAGEKLVGYSIVPKREANWQNESDTKMQQLNFSFSVPKHMVDDVRQIMYKLSRLIQLDTTHKRNITSVISSILSNAIMLLEVKDSK